MNTFELRLNEKPFNSIKKGTKTIEMRLLDEKRNQYQIGDILIFKKRPEEIEILKTRIVNLHKVNSFSDLYFMFDKSKLGYEENEIANRVVSMAHTLVGRPYIFLWDDATIWEYSDSHKGSHNYDKTLYPEIN